MFTTTGRNRQKQPGLTARRDPHWLLCVAVPLRLVNITCGGLFGAFCLLALESWRVNRDGIFAFSLARRGYRSTSPSSSPSCRDDDPASVKRQPGAPAPRDPSVQAAGNSPPAVDKAQPAAELVLAIDGLRLGVNCPAGNTHSPRPTCPRRLSGKDSRLRGFLEFLRSRRQDACWVPGSVLDGPFGRAASQRAGMDVEMEPPGPPMVPPPPDLSPEQQLQPEGAQSAVIRRRAPIACRRCVCVFQLQPPRFCARRRRR
jgi:hypothetical protein